MEVLPTTVVQRLQQSATEHKVTKTNCQCCQPQSNGTRIQHCSCIDLCVHWWTRGFQNICIPLYRFLIAWPLDMTPIDYYISFALNSHRQNKRILAHTCSPIFSEACTHSHSCALTLVRICIYSIHSHFHWHLLVPSNANFCIHNHSLAITRIAFTHTCEPPPIFILAFSET